MNIRAKTRTAVSVPPNSDQLGPEAHKGCHTLCGRTGMIDNKIISIRVCWVGWANLPWQLGGVSHMIWRSPFLPKACGGLNLNFRSCHAKSLDCAHDFPHFHDQSHYTTVHKVAKDSTIQWSSSIYQFDWYETIPFKYMWWASLLFSHWSCWISVSGMRDSKFSAASALTHHKNHRYA